ncbi:MAG: hypothetical protein ACKERG_04615 [Candidatus Hodgkinia cicadicola]
MFWLNKSAVSFGLSGRYVSWVDTSTFKVKANACCASEAASPLLLFFKERARAARESALECCRLCLSISSSTKIHC